MIDNCVFMRKKRIVNKIKFTLSILFTILLLSCNCKKKQKKEFLPSSKLYSISTPQVDKVYGVAKDGTELKLDLYLASQKMGGPKEYINHYAEKRPTVIFIHGGAWVSGNKSTSVFEVLPYIEKGWQVVNINYRFATGKSFSIADCIDDVNMALDWVVKNADKYYFNTSKIIVSGDSAGGHLALMLGLANTSNVKIAGVVNWYGVTDLEKCIATWDDKDFVNDLVEDKENFTETCKKLSPVTYVTKKAPPIITIHGTSDETVPYSQGKLLHEKLNERGVSNQLLTMKGKKHGNFNAEDMAVITKSTFDFLKENGIE